MSLLEPTLAEPVSPDEFQRQAAERVTPYAEYAGAKLMGGLEALRPVEALGLASLPSRFAPDEYGLPPPGPPPADLMSKDQFDASAYKRPGLEWEEGETEARASARAAVHDRQAYRDSLVARSDTGWLGQAAGFGIGFGAAALDPTNYIPLIGPASKAAMVARFGRVGGALLGHGADAALNTGLFEPLAATTAQAEGRSYGWEEAGSDILMNALGGALLGTAAGEAARALGFGHGERPDVVGTSGPQAEPASGFRPPRIAEPIAPPIVGVPEAGIAGLAEPLPTITEPIAPPIVGVPEAGAGVVPRLDEALGRYLNPQPDGAGALGTPHNTLLRDPAAYRIEMRARGWSDERIAAREGVLRGDVRALDAAMTPSSAPLTLYRGERAYEGGGVPKVGEVVERPELLSTTSNPRVADMASAPGVQVRPLERPGPRVVYEIDTPAGTPMLQRFDAASNEREAILARGTRLRVREVTRDGETVRVKADALPPAGVGVVPRRAGQPPEPLRTVAPEAAPDVEGPGSGRPPALHSMTLDEVRGAIADLHAEDMRTVTHILGSEDAAREYLRQERIMMTGSEAGAEAARAKIERLVGDKADELDGALNAPGRPTLEDLQEIENAREEEANFRLHDDEFLARSLSKSMEGTTPAAIASALRGEAQPARVHAAIVRMTSAMAELRRRGLSAEEIGQHIVGSSIRAGASREQAAELLAEFMRPKQRPAEQPVPLAIAPPRRAGQPPLRVDDLMRRADAADLALDQIDRGEPVDVGKVLANDPAMRQAPAPVRADPAEGVAITSAGRHVPVRYDVVEARDLIASHTDDMHPNPAFPAELQPRDRTRAASGSQVAAMAGSLEPALLGRSATASEGAPIVGPDAVVESGNARVLAIRKAYREALPGSVAYRQELARQGYDVAGVEAPVLVRRRTGEMAPADRAAFAREANVSGVAAMGTAERAGSDAAALKPDHLEMLQSADMHAAGNRPFVRAFLGTLPEGERGGLLTASGELSKAGGERLRNAILAKAFGDAELVARLAEEPDSGLNGLGQALTGVAPEWAKMRTEAAAGRIAPEGDGTAALLEALHAIIAAKAAGNPPHFALEQGDMLGGGLSRDGAAFLRAFLVIDRKGGSRVLGREKLAAVLDRYVTEARKQQPGVDMFGNRPATPAEILEGRRGPMSLEKAAPEPPHPSVAEAAPRVGKGTPELETFAKDAKLEGYDKPLPGHEPKPETVPGGGEGRPAWGPGREKQLAEAKARAERLRKRTEKAEAQGYDPLARDPDFREGGRYAAQGVSRLRTMDLRGADDAVAILERIKADAETPEGAATSSATNEAAKVNTPAEKAAATAALPPELQEVEAMRREGSLTPADEATLTAGEAEATRAESYADAWTTLVACVARNV